MKNHYRLLLCSAFALNSFALNAQDILFFTNGKQMEVKVQEITPDKDVKYKRFDNQDGPTYTALRTDVTKVKYKNGTVEEFGPVEGTNGGNTKVEGQKNEEKKFDINDTETQNMIEALAKNAGDKVLNRCATRVDNATVDVFYDQVFKDPFTGDLDIPIIVKWDKGLNNNTRWIKGTVKITKDGKKTWSYTDDSGIWFSKCAKTITDL